MVAIVRYKTHVENTRRVGSYYVNKIKKYEYTNGKLSYKQCDELYYEFLCYCDCCNVLDHLYHRYNYIPTTFNVFTDDLKYRQYPDDSYDTYMSNMLTNICKIWKHLFKPNDIFELLKYAMDTDKTGDINIKCLETLEKHIQIPENMINNIFEYQVSRLHMKQIYYLSKKYDLLKDAISKDTIVKFIKQAIYDKKPAKRIHEFCVFFDVVVDDLEKHGIIEEVALQDIEFVKELSDIFDITYIPIPKKIIYSILEPFVKNLRKDKHVLKKHIFRDLLLFLRDICGVTNEDIIESGILKLVISVRNTCALKMFRYDIFSISARDINIIVNDPSVTCAKGDTNGFARYKLFISQYTTPLTKGAFS